MFLRSFLLLLFRLKSRFVLFGSAALDDLLILQFLLGDRLCQDTGYTRCPLREAKLRLLGWPPRLHHAHERRDSARRTRANLGWNWAA